MPDTSLLPLKREGHPLQQEGGYFRIVLRMSVEAAQFCREPSQPGEAASRESGEVKTYEAKGIAVRYAPSSGGIEDKY